MTLKEFFNAVVAKFETNVRTLAMQNSTYRTDGMCYCIMRVADDLGLEYGSEIVIEAGDFLKTYRHDHAEAYWFPTRRLDYSDEECITPRRAILQRILADLEEKLPPLTLKKFFEMAQKAFEADVEKRSSPDSLYMWSDGLCIALATACEDLHKQKLYSYDTVEYMYSKACQLLANYKPENPGEAYWWPTHKFNSTQEDAITPRRAVFKQILASL